MAAKAALHSSSGGHLCRARAVGCDLAQAGKNIGVWLTSGWYLSITFYSCLLVPFKPSFPYRWASCMNMFSYHKEMRNWNRLRLLADICRLFLCACPCTIIHSQARPLSDQDFDWIKIPRPREPWYEWLFNALILSNWSSDGDRMYQEKQTRRWSRLGSRAQS